MTDLATDPGTLKDETARFLNPATTADERQAQRRMNCTRERKLAFEEAYVAHVGGDQPERFIRQSLAALFLTGGFTTRESAQQILAELREFASQHQLDFDRIYNDVSTLPGARRSRPQRRRFALLNLGLFASLAIGTLLLQQLATPPLQVLLQVGLLVGVLVGQMLLLYRYLV